ncbi:hypothetical protein TNIN_88101 [Trichonephila inaurata madagascariensis]|uniref:Uncharacterized protein n=1 Tax=Trichonephila inaurata madagascariensis TaxID=2747483 RepID=A0A8X6X959_9ARAC|nr:hypothetical protein TNIN_88101 [Trichonephila inaurata madagascariensis]
MGKGGVSQPKTLERTRTPKGRDWEGAMDKKCGSCCPKKSLNCRTPRGSKVLGSFGFIEVRLDDGVTFPAGWCVNRVWVPWMSTSSPQYRPRRG